MKPRCGIDIVFISRMEKMLETLEDKLSLFSHSEIEYCEQKANSVPSYAARFAAKEACLKCFAKELALKDLDFSDIEINNDAYGAPFVVLNDKLSGLLHEYQLSEVSISLSHTKDYACAMVIMS